MSRSRFGQGKKPLDTFFWVNEVTGVVTYPPRKADVTAASREKPQEELRGSVQGAPSTAQSRASSPAQKAAPPALPTASMRHGGSRNSLPSTLTHSLARAGARSPLRFSAISVTISPPGGAPPTFGPLGPAGPSTASPFPPRPSVPWDFTCKMRNVLTGNNRFSF
ncbi:hypothetical protein mRhiFer1_008559 [Rhinolophus ferrumequinum]|uniref:Uncharacterized protein n=1 Tax=Rhinolophus ferrumequinum TaxID=59479 RepID=A0A7J7UJG4_RHIFE|nr:hypothetical protein mRhiFer1_008559 [Rhinolophus ferrumequinum]